MGIAWNEGAGEGANSALCSPFIFVLGQRDVSIIHSHYGTQAGAEQGTEGAHLPHCRPLSRPDSVLPQIRSWRHFLASVSCRLVTRGSFAPAPGFKAATEKLVMADCMPTG